MKLGQSLEQTQKLSLTYSMRQSLRLLKLPVQDLQEYLEDIAQDNPLLNVDTITENIPLPNAINKIEKQDKRETMDFSWWNKRSTDSTDDFTAYFSREKSFTEYLKEQIAEMKNLNGFRKECCIYLVDCLNTLGYLDCPLQDLAHETGTSIYDMEQALSVVQSLEPAGVGARNLSECLMIQLKQSPYDREPYIQIIQSGLPLLAKKEFLSLSKLLHISDEKTRQAVKIILGLNPIPSRGFCSNEINGYIQPEAIIKVENHNITVEMNDCCFPNITLDETYCEMLKNPQYITAKEYLKEKLADAKNIIIGVKKRSDTLFSLICLAVQEQKEYFLNNTELQPLNMKQIADKMGVNVSTISRAVNGKYIQFRGSVFPIRSLFVSSLQQRDNTNISSRFVKKRLQNIIAEENKQHPLSDDVLSKMLARDGINISRRTIAKYRYELEIPNASVRRKDLDI